ncbi:MAG: hypothetical protein ACE15D_11135 [Candidatus Eisenbacteria bacterium]|nr:hypothetical protein [Candidatus Eisenbacteria bacterium]
MSVSVSGDVNGHGQGKSHGGPAGGAASSSAGWPANWLPLVAEAAAILSRSLGRPRWSACIEDASGARFSGVSISIDDLPAGSICAETGALASLRLAGGKAGARRLVLIGPPPRGAAAPCGSCLQRLLEAGGEDLEIRWGTARRQRGAGKLSDLLPEAFVEFRPQSRRRSRGGA